MEEIPELGASADLVERLVAVFSRLAAAVERLADGHAHLAESVALIARPDAAPGAETASTPPHPFHGAHPDELAPAQSAATAPGAPIERFDQLPALGTKVAALKATVLTMTVTETQAGRVVADVQLGMTGGSVFVALWGGTGSYWTRKGVVVGSVVLLARVVVAAPYQGLPKLKWIPGVSVVEVVC